MERDRCVLSRRRLRREALTLISKDVIPRAEPHTRTDSGVGGTGRALAGVRWSELPMSRSACAS